MYKRQRLQGVEINDKHIEVIVRQMLQKIRVEENEMCIRDSIWSGASEQMTILTT